MAGMSFRTAFAESLLRVSLVLRSNVHAATRPLQRRSTERLNRSAAPFSSYSATYHLRQQPIAALSSDAKPKKKT